MDSYILVIAQASTSADNADKFGQVEHEFARACRTEPGCLSYEVFRSVERPERYVSVEKYADQEAFAAHRASEHFRDIGLGQLMPLAESIDVQLFEGPRPAPRPE